MEGSGNVMIGNEGERSAVMLLYRTGGGGLIEQCGKVTLPHCSPTTLSSGGMIK